MYVSVWCNKNSLVVDKDSIGSGRVIETYKMGCLGHGGVFFQLSFAWLFCGSKWFHGDLFWGYDSH